MFCLGALTHDTVGPSDPLNIEACDGFKLFSIRFEIRFQVACINVREVMHGPYIEFRRYYGFDVQRAVSEFCGPYSSHSATMFAVSAILRF
jgi:hypothetical protein